MIMKGILHRKPHACGGCCTRLIDFGVTLSRAVILEHINLHIHCGELTVIIGPNGGGKTTLFRALLGEVPHTGKKAFYRPEKDQEEKPVFGYVPQKLEFDATSPMTVLDVFAAANSLLPLWLGIHKKVSEQAAATLKAVEADHLLHYKIGMLSGGQLQRVLLGLALTPVPDILLLDEPVSGVDPNGIELFYRMVSELREKYHMTILMASHDLSAAGSYADRIIFLNKSILHDGRPEEVLADPLVTQTFGHTPIIRKPLAPSPQPETCCRFHHDREGVI